MRRIVLTKKDRPETLSSLFGVPVCMMMRANKGRRFLPQAVWNVPDTGYCAARDGCMEQCRFHICMENETIESIAALYNVTPYAILHENAIHDPRAPQHCRVLRIPATPKGMQIYHCSSTDTLMGISKKYTIPFELFCELNRLAPDTARAYAGLCLYVPAYM